MNKLSTVFRKEVASFFNSLIAYVVMSVFLVGVGLFFWVFEFNVLETGYAEMDTLFFMGPYLLLFLVPAITMRAFSEEMKTGTIELLATKPLTDWQIILGKYLAAVFLVLFSILPTLIYAFSLSFLGNPPNNLDWGGITGSYLGLFLLGSIFAAIGLFTSVLSDNQIIAFILGVFLCFFFFLGFDYIAGIKVLEGINAYLLRLSINEHYYSISRGVLDSRDLLYFFSFIAIALMACKAVLNSRRR